MDIRRRENENLLEYQLRLYKNKDLYGITFQDIADVLNKETGENFSESKYRKFLTAFVKGYDFAINNSNLIDKEITKQEHELFKKKVQTQDQLRELRKLLRVEGRINHLRDEMISAIERINKTSPLHWYKQEDYFNDDNKESILMLSDFHKGLFAKNFWNEYNDDEFYRRLNYLINKSIKYNKSNNVKTVHIMQLGDMIHGMIHRLTRLMDTEDAISATQSVSEALAELISVHANEFEKIKVYNIRGNHDRISTRKEEEIAKESLNDLIPWYLKTRLSNFENVEFVDNEYDDEIIVADVAGFKVFAVHGHRDKLNSIIQDLSLMIKTIPDYVLSGHIHKNYENEIHGIEHIVNNSFSGVDEYAKEIRKTSKPAQKLLIFDKKIGRECTYNIRLDRL